MDPTDMHEDMFPGDEDAPGGDDTEEEFWFDAPGEGRGEAPEDAPDYNFRDDARRTYMIVGSIIAIFGFFGILWFLYYQKNMRDADNPPLIAAETGPVRERPEDPGGMDVPHQDMLIFDKVNGEKTEIEDSIQPGPEQPMNDLENDLEDDMTMEELIQETEPELVPQPPARVAEVTQPAATSGNFLIQLGAFSERQVADDAWEDIQTTHWQLLADFSPDVDSITTSSGRTLYRLRIGNFETRNHADRVCGQLKQRGQDCLVTTR